MKIVKRCLFEYLPWGYKLHRMEQDVLTAAARGYDDVITELKDDVVKYLTIVDDFGNTPLHLAASGNHDNIVRMLIHARANIDAQNNLGETPLHRASLRGSENSVRELIQSGANIMILNSNDRTALDIAKTEDVMLLFPNYEGKGHPIDEITDDTPQLEFEDSNSEEDGEELEAE